MLCLLALLVFATLAVFSARYRPLAREAVDCVFRRLTLRKCTTALDQRVNAMLTARLMESHPSAARFVHRHLEVMAWVFVLLSVGAAVYLSNGFYNFYRYGHCDGPAGEGFCIFDPTGRHARRGGVAPGPGASPSTPGEGGNPALGPLKARLTIIEFGSYTCPETRQLEPAMRQLVARYGDEIRFVYRHFPLDAEAALGGGSICEESSRPGASSEHAGATRAAVAADCAGAQGRFWEYHRLLTESPDALASCAGLTALADGLGMDEAGFIRCLEDPTIRDHVRRDFEAGVGVGIFGTPTLFLDGAALVAPSAESLAETVDAALAPSRP